MKKIRDLNIQEVRFLKSSIKESEESKKRSIKLFIFMLCITLIIGLTAFYYHRDSKIELKFFVILIVLVYILITLWVFIERSINIKLFINEALYALENNEVISIEVKAMNCIELSEENHEGNYFIFQLDDNKIILIGGQEFEINKKFPNDNFEIAVCYDRKGHVLFHEIYTYGNKLLPIKRITGEKKQKILFYTGYSDFSEFQLINGHIDEIFDL